MSSTYTRREMLGRALLAGAGATVVGSLAPEAALAAINDAPTPPDPHFLAGSVATVRSNGALSMIDLDGRLRAAQLGSFSQVWKHAAWGLDPLALGDCIYATGSLGSDGVFGVDKIYVGIEALSATVRDRAPGLLLLDAHGQQIDTGLIARTQVQRPDGSFAPGTEASPAIGDEVLVVGFHDGPQKFTASRILRLDPNATPSAAELQPIKGKPVQVGPDILCPTTWTGLATFFCCGTNGQACGWNCTNEGPPWCTNQTCSSQGHYMAWKSIDQNGTRQCNAVCGNCCDNTLSQVECGTTGHLYNPCSGLSDTAPIVDCGPNMSCLANPYGCQSRKAIKFDLTPCAYAAIGGDISAGHTTCNVTIYFQC